jgi:hypothetical protein
MTEGRSVVPPTPEVQHLPTIFRRIRLGEIRIPAFQRPFVWEEDQVIELLESVYSGFPIGSILLWRVDRPTLKIDTSEWTKFPDTVEKYPIYFILDGMQRVSTLFGVCNESDGQSPSKFNVLFDLREERFVHYDPDDLPTAYVRLADLFLPKRMMEVQKFLGSQTDGDILIDRMLHLYSVFQEYMLPMVTIHHDDLREVVRIFERINGTGTRLGAVDFMRAVTWSEQFDLNRHLAAVNLAFADTGFKFEDDGLVKLLGILLGKDPVPNSLIGLRDLRDDELRAGIQSVTNTLQRVVVFLRKHFAIYSSEYVPYEGQVLVLAKALSTRELDERQEKILKEWYWATSFNESLRGRPDHVVARLVNSVGAALTTGASERFRTRINLREADFLERRFIKGKALSSAVASMFAINAPRSLFDETAIRPEVIMSEFSAEHFQPIFPIDELRAIWPELSSARVLSNIFVVTDSDRRDYYGKAAPWHIANLAQKNDQSAQKTLESQFINPTAAAAIVNNDLRAFLAARASAMFGAAMRLMGSETVPQ